MLGVEEVKMMHPFAKGPLLIFTIIKKCYMQGFWTWLGHNGVPANSTNIQESWRKLQQLLLHFGKEVVNTNQKHTNSWCNRPSSGTNVHFGPEASLALPLSAVSVCICVLLCVRMVWWTNTEETYGEPSIIYLPVKERKSDGERVNVSMLNRVILFNTQFPK